MNSPIASDRDGSQINALGFNELLPALYELADMKLKTGAVAPAPATTTTGPGLAGSSPLDAGTTRNDAEGIPDGSTFGITEVTSTDSPDADAETNMKLKIAVKVRPGATEPALTEDMAAFIKAAPATLGPF